MKKKFEHEGRPERTSEEWDRVEAELNREWSRRGGGLGGYYDRNGKPIGLGTWARRFEDEKYKRVLATQLSDGVWVSTVWLGLNHAFGGRPLIFETMIFRHDDGGEEMFRYSTEAEARDGHTLAVARLLAAGHEPITETWAFVITETWAFVKMFDASMREFAFREQFRRTLEPMMCKRKTELTQAEEEVR